MRLRQQEEAREESKLTHTREDDIPGGSRGEFPLQRSAALGEGKRDYQLGGCRGKRVAQPGAAFAAADRGTGQRDHVDDRVADHQLDGCELTFHELREVVESFCFTLGSMLHRRVAYPKKAVVESGAATATYELASSMREQRERARALTAPAAARVVS